MEIGDLSRLETLLVHTILWSIVWILLLAIVPSGKSGRDHILILNASHGLLSTFVSISTIYYKLDSTTSVAISVSYFAVDMVHMILPDRALGFLSLHRSRYMDYMHHFLGIFWGITLYTQELSVCTEDFGNAYVWIQTNEISTGFYNWFRATQSTVAGFLFAITFFLSRIVFNTVYLIPRLIHSCDLRHLAGCMPFFILQYVWFVMIMKKINRTVKKKAQ